jgi:pectinesterase
MNVKSEYIWQSTGEGANPQRRAKISKQLKSLKGYEPETILAGGDGWNPIKKGTALVEVIR